jgi:hypothetical protein
MHHVARNIVLLQNEMKTLIWLFDNRTEAETSLTPEPVSGPDPEPLSSPWWWGQ